MLRIPNIGLFGHFVKNPLISSPNREQILGAFSAEKTAYPNFHFLLEFFDEYFRKKCTIICETYLLDFFLFLQLPHQSSMLNSKTFLVSAFYVENTFSHSIMSNFLSKPLFGKSEIKHDAEKWFGVPSWNLFLTIYSIFEYHYLLHFIIGI